MSKTISIRISDERYTILEEKSGDMSVHTFIKKKVEAYADSVQKSASTVPIYNPSVHKVGDKVLVRRGKKLIEAVVPEVDADGGIIP